MKKLPMAQMLTSDAKLTVRCDQEYVYKGPYDLTKKGYFSMFTTMYII